VRVAKRNLCLWFTLTIEIIFLVSCSHIQPTDVPVPDEGQKWRIGYYEGGAWFDYQSELISLLEGLVDLGLIDAFELPDLPDHEDTSYLWKWLSNNIESETIQFAADAYWSSSWEDDKRIDNKQDCLRRLREDEDIDIIIAMGTWAGQDLANNQHKIPTLVMSTSNPIDAGIIESAQNSGYPHVHAKCDPEEQIREIRNFHDLIEFQRVGVIYDYNYEDSKIYAAIPELEQVANERGFEIATCDVPEFNLSDVEIRSATEKCLWELAPIIDAFYVTAHNGLDVDYMPEILEPMFVYKIPTWAQEGPDYVKNGVLLSIARKDTKAVGKFEAETMEKVLNGTNPGDLPQVFREPKKMAINLETARRIGFEPPSGLITSANEVYERIKPLNP
jgi:ABC-type uncharacterized transport system substrate-binding protein